MSRGGRGGRGGSAKPSIFTPQLLGHLNYADIISTSKEGTGIYYPPMEIPQTQGPTEREAAISRRYENYVGSMKYGAHWIDPPAQQTNEIQKFADQFKPTTSSADPLVPLRELHIRREYDPALFPPSIFEACYENKSKNGRGKGKGRAAKVSLKDMIDAEDDEDENGLAKDRTGDNSQSDLDDDPEDEEEPEENESDNDYGEDHFDNGEEDGGDALGGGGDEEGGTFD